MLEGEVALAAKTDPLGHVTLEVALGSDTRQTGALWRLFTSKPDHLAGDGRVWRPFFRLPRARTMKGRDAARNSPGFIVVVSDTADMAHVRHLAMKTGSIIVLVVAWLQAVAVAASGGESKAGIVTMVDFTTSVRRQMQRNGLLDALIAAPTVQGRLVSSVTDPAPDGVIVEPAIHAKSAVISLTDAQRVVLWSVFSDDGDYEESMAPCLCEFQPQLRITFASSENAGVSHDILVGATSHGEIQAFTGGHLVTYARTQRFVPAFLAFLETAFPGDGVTLAVRASINEAAERRTNKQPN